MPQHFLEPRYLGQLASPEETYAELRRTVFHGFRNPEKDISMKPWPWVYGDTMDVPMPQLANAMNALTPVQLALLEKWADHVAGVVAAEGAELLA